MTTNTYEERDAWRINFNNVTAPAIVAELARVEPDHGWALEPCPEDESPRYRNIRAINKRGERLWFNVDDHKQRVSVHGSYGEINGRVWIPRDAVRDAEDPQPTMSTERGAGPIVKDLQRRFFPKYRELRAVYLARVESSAQYKVRLRASFDRIMAAGGPILRAGRNDDKGATEMSASLYTAGSGNSGDVRVADTYVRFDRLSVTPEIAIEIMKVFKKHCKPYRQGED